jgi:hypothetical protein
MHPHFFGLALWLPLSATVLEIPDQVNSNLTKLFLRDF